MTRLPRPCIVDTNVAIVANGRSEQADDALTEKCIDIILQITETGGLVLDSDGRIFDEYWQNLNLSGQPGTGDLFVKWVHDFQWRPEFCEQRQIHCLNEDEQEFAEFPKNENLQDFDVSDRKFVAVANAGSHCPILQAVDFKWWGWKDTLADEGIDVVFVDDKAAEEGYRKHMTDG